MKARNKSLMAYLFFTFAVPLAAKAQEAEEAAGAAVVTQSSGASHNVMQNSGNQIPMFVNKAIDYVSQIGNLFGNATGFRIGGTTVTAIATLVIAKLIEDKAPSWVKYVLYATGGTMFMGSGANITQLVTRFLG